MQKWLIAENPQNLIPWNTCGAFILSTLGVGVAQYGPWDFFNWLMPIAGILMAYLGLTIADQNGKRFANKSKRQGE